MSWRTWWSKPHLRNKSTSARPVFLGMVPWHPGAFCLPLSVGRNMKVAFAFAPKRVPWMMFWGQPAPFFAHNSTYFVSVGGTARPYLAVGQNQWHHFGVGAPPILVGIGMFTGGTGF